MALWHASSADASAHIAAESADVPCSRWLAASAASTSRRAYPRPNTRSIWLGARRHHATKRPPASLCDRDWRPSDVDACGLRPDRLLRAFERTAISVTIARRRSLCRVDLADRAA